MFCHQIHGLEGVWVLVHDIVKRFLHQHNIFDPYLPAEKQSQAGALGQPAVACSYFNADAGIRPRQDA